MALREKKLTNGSWASVETESLIPVGEWPQVMSVDHLPKAK